MPTRKNPHRTERVPMSPADRAARIRRCARALKAGTMLQDLMRTYTGGEIDAAREMIRKPGNQ